MFEKISEMKKEWIYLGAFINDELRQTLLKKYKSIIPEGWNLYCDHATFAFNDDSETAQNIFEKYKSSLGEEVGLCTIGIGRSEEAIALELSKDDFETSNKIFHITLATAPGCKPVRSNFITEWKPMLTYDITKAKIGYFAKGKINFTYNG